MTLKTFILLNFHLKLLSFNRFSFKCMTQSVLFPTKTSYIWQIYIKIKVLYSSTLPFILEVYKLPIFKSQSLKK